MGPVGCTNLDSWRVSADMEQNPSRNGREDNWPVSNQTRPDRKHGFVMPCDKIFQISQQTGRSVQFPELQQRNAIHSMFFAGPVGSSLLDHLKVHYPGMVELSKRKDKHNFWDKLAENKRNE